MQNYDYSRLHSSLVGVIQEAQTKIGYDRHAITFYYPAASLAHMLGTKEDADTVEQALAGFSAFAQPTLGGGILHAGLFILACLVPSAALFRRRARSTSTKRCRTAAFSRRSSRS